MDRSANMRAIRSKDMVPERAVRRLIHNAGYRYRLHRSDLPGKPDLVFGRRQKVIFVHGCFWHMHGCKSGHIPKSNVGYWIPKLRGNQARDEKNLAALKAGDWKSLIVWECETRDIEKVMKRVVRFLSRSL